MPQKQQNTPASCRDTSHGRASALEGGAHSGAIICGTQWPVKQQHRSLTTSATPPALRPDRPVDMLVRAGMLVTQGLFTRARIRPTSNMEMWPHASNIEIRPMRQNMDTRQATRWA